MKSYFSQALLACGSASLAAPLIFSPATLVPSTTVLPMPLAVSLIPSPACLAPVSTCFLAASTLLVSVVLLSAGLSTSSARTDAGSPARSSAAMIAMS